MENKVRMLEEKAKEIRKLTIQAIGELGVGHIGGALSLCEVLSVLYFDAMNIDPVSYTHLDVYKRQVLWLCIRSTGCYGCKPGSVSKSS